jgi:hypothetical protein
LASVASADTVKCTPLVRDGVVVGFCFTVCNTQKNPCFTDGCIWDLHLEIIRSNCVFTKVIRLPVGWQGGVSATNPQGFDAKTPDAAGLTKPILPGQCATFCIGMNAKECLSQEPCVYVKWVTTAIDPVTQEVKVRATGVTKCCLPPPPQP